MFAICSSALLTVSLFIVQ